MKAASIAGDGRITVRDVAMPQAGPGEVLLRVGACALCGSDLRPLQRGWTCTPGHEILGVVDQPGHAWHGRRAGLHPGLLRSLPRMRCWAHAGLPQRDRSDRLAA